MKRKGEFFLCSCKGEGLWIEHDEEWGTEIALFERSPFSRSWRNRLRLAWAALKGKPYGDQVILDDATLANVVDLLVDIQNKEYTIN